MPHFRCYLMALCAVCLPIAAQAEPFSFPGLDDPKLAEAIGQAMERPDPRICAELSPLWAEALKRSKSPTTALAVMSANMAVQCAIEEERYEDASSLIARTEARLGQQAVFDSVALALHSHLREFEFAVARIETIASRNGGEVLARTEPAMIYQLSNNIARAKRHDLREKMWSAIHASPVFLQLDPDLRGGAAINLLSVKADNATLKPEDGKLIDLLGNAGAYAVMLAERRYAPIWPYMEERAGDGLARIIKEDLALNTARYEAEPESGERLSDLGYALLQAGEIRKLIDLTAQFNTKEADYSTLDERGAWVVNYMAIALMADGRTEEGLAALGRLAALDPAQHPWVVNYVINYGTALAEDGQHEAALRALDRAQPVAEEHGSAYARALVAGERACSLHELGRTSEVAQYLSILEQLRPDAPSAVIGYAMCAGRDDLAIAWALAALANDRSRPAAISELQPGYMSDSPRVATAQEPHQLLAKSPELAAAFAKVARVVPERFAPLGGRIRFAPSHGKQGMAKP